MDLFPHDLCLYKYKEFSLHGTISSVLFQNIIITATVLETRSPTPRLLPVQKCKQLYFRFSSKLLANFLDSGTGFWEFNYAGEACEARDY